MIRLISKNYLILSMIFLSLVVFSIHAEKYTLVIEPTFPVDQGKQVYEPLRQWLNKKTGDQIEIIIDKNYYFYWRNANGSREPDFTFDASHIASFRAKKKNYRYLAVKVEPLSFHLISLDEPEKNETVQDYMVSKKIVMLPSPSLASVYFEQWFTDLFSAPNKDVTALSWQETIEIVFDGGADAAIVPNWMYNLYPNFVSLLNSKDIPGTTFMASSKLPDAVVEKFQNALLSLIDDEAAYDVLVELNTEGFKKPDPKQYKELTKLLPGSN
jgi:hypothetical protein